MKKIWFVLSVLLVAAFVLTACGKQTTPTAAPAPTQAPAKTQAPKPTEAPTKAPTQAPKPTATPKPTLKGTVTLWHAWKENEMASLNDVIKAFQAKYPDVKVNVLYVPFDDLRGKYETAASSGSGPTVLIGAADWGPALYEAGLVADLTPYVDKDFLSNINKAALGAVEYKGALIGLPETLKGVVMYRNTSILPNAPKTFDELVKMSQEHGKCAFLERGFFFSAAHLMGLGGQLMDAQGNPMFNNEKGVEWVKLLERFSEAGNTTYYTDDDVNMFKAGKACIIIDGTWNMSNLAQAVGKDKISIDPWPTPLSGFVQTENIYLSTNAEGDNQKASIAFIKFFLSPEAQKLLANPDKAAHIPAIKGIEVTDPLMKEAMVAFEGGQPFPVIPEMGAYWGPMDNALKSVFDKGVDPKTALQQAYDAITAKIKEIRSGNGG